MNTRKNKRGFVHKSEKYFTLIPKIFQYSVETSGDRIKTVQRKQKREEKEPCLNMFLN